MLIRDGMILRWQSTLYIPHLAVVMTPLGVLDFWTFTATLIDLHQCVVYVPQTFIAVINLSSFPYFTCYITWIYYDSTGCSRSLDFYGHND